MTNQYSHFGGDGFKELYLKELASKEKILKYPFPRQKKLQQSQKEFEKLKKRECKLKKRSARAGKLIVPRGSGRKSTKGEF